MGREDAQVHFDTLTIEGGLFTADWLGKIASFAAPSQGESDYQIRAGFTLREEIALAWRSAQALWAQFEKARTASGHDAAAITQRFVVELLKQAFGFQLHSTPTPVNVDGRFFPIRNFAFNGAVPVITGVHSLALDTADLAFGDPSGTRRRRSAFGLLQEFLNAQSASLWGIVSNGLLIRVARDNASLTRPAWLQSDLERLFQEERFAEFSVLWLTLHATRFGCENLAPSECVLERWRDACRDQGVRARDVLREGVKQALLMLGDGFLSHHANTALREALTTQRLTTRDFFQQLLRLVYRQIFLLTIEERGILHPEDSSPTSRQLYAEGYSLRRLRDRVVRRNAHDRHHDLWEGLKLVWKSLARGEPRLAIPAIGGLFAESQCRDLDDARLENRHLLLGLFHLAWLREKNQANGPLTRVNWRDMGPEELGSIYESLLELAPQVGDDSRSFSFLEGAETRGNERKTSGSYYTPDSLVQLLLESALEPVISTKLAAHPSGQPAVNALLSITIIDPACGSGHFLLSAARRIATHLARVLAEASGSGQPTPVEYRHAMRQVITHCIFGVDRNPMALELARTALWLEAYTPDAPLGFIDHHLVCGDALIGVMDPRTLLQGIPDEAYKPSLGDDPDVCRALKAANRVQRRSLETLLARSPQLQLGFQVETTADELSVLDALPDDTLEAVEEKRLRHAKLVGGSMHDRQRLLTACDLFVSAFFSPKRNVGDLPTTQDVVSALMDQPLGTRDKVASENASGFSALHWVVTFAQVFAKGGFSCVLGNPPWEQLQLNEQEFFASRSPHIATLDGDRRKRAIALLPETDPRLAAEFEAEKRRFEAAGNFVRAGGRYPLTAIGKLNTYPLFAETAVHLTADQGRAGLVLPSGVATDDSTSTFFAYVSDGRMVQLIDFENREGLFPAVDSRMKFCLLTLGAASEARFAFFLSNPLQLSDTRRAFTLSAEDIARLNPNTRTCPVFRSQKDAELAKKIYGRVSVLFDEKKADGNPWGVSFRQGLFNMTSDSSLFRDASQRDELHEPMRLYEAKMIDFYDHRRGSYHTRGSDRGYRVLPETTAVEYANPDFSVTPFYWVARDEVLRQLPPEWRYKWLYAFKDITSSTNERTFIGTVIPLTGVGNNLPLLFVDSSVSASTVACLVGSLGSIALDYFVRLKIGGLHMNFYLVKQLPVLPPSVYTDSLKQQIVPRVLELIYTAHDLRPFYDDIVGDDSSSDPRRDEERGRPWKWDPERRSVLRAELDAIYARLYGLTRDELRFVLDPSDVMEVDYPSETFRVLKKNEWESERSMYRTQRLVLEAWDRFYGR
jgi:hypothetical protein